MIVLRDPNSGRRWLNGESPQKLILLVKICLEGSTSRVKIDGTLSDCFEVRRGLKQGDALSPVLFNIASVFRNFEHREQIFSPAGISLILADANDRG